MQKQFAKLILGVSAYFEIYKRVDRRWHRVVRTYGNDLSVRYAKRRDSYPCYASYIPCYAIPYHVPRDLSRDIIGQRKTYRWDHPDPQRYAIKKLCNRVVRQDCRTHLGVAQLVERYLGVVEAASSSLVTQTISSVHNRFQLWTLDIFMSAFIFRCLE